MASFNQIYSYANHSNKPKAEKIRFGVRAFLYGFAGPCAISQYLELNEKHFCPKVVCKILEAPQRLFYDNRMGFYERSLFIKRHYELAHKFLPEALRQKIYTQQTVTLAVLQGKSGRRYEFRLGFDFCTEKEGCLCLSLEDEEHGSIVKVAFSFSSVGREFDQDTEIIKMGCLQSCSEDTLNVLRSVTKDVHGIQPRILIVDALKIFGSALGFNSLEGVSNKHHIYTSYRYKRKLHLDYDGLWQFLGFEQGLSGNFYSGTELQHKPLTDYPSHKRSEQSKRRLLLNQLQCSISEALIKNI